MGETSTPTFAGFPDAKARFFKALARNNDRAWFVAHKAESRPAGTSR